MPHLTKVVPGKWKITLPTFHEPQVSDNSKQSEYTDCPRKGLYRYGLRRGFDGDHAWSMKFGLAYHKYRETVEKLMLASGESMSDEIHLKGVEESSKDWEDPPDNHRKSYLDYQRFMHCVTMARKRIENEQKNGTIKVTRSEEAFDLELPFWMCKDCSWGFLEESEECSRCGGELFPPRHGGRVDQDILFTSLGNAFMIRDFKTTGYGPKTYESAYDPNAQIQGYVWSRELLAGRRPKGALIEIVYNTKTKGPEIKQIYIEYTEGQQQQWLASVMVERQMINLMWSRVDELGYLAFPQRTSRCTDYGGCPYVEACKCSSGKELENWLKQNTVESHWDFTNPDD